MKKFSFAYDHYQKTYGHNKTINDVRINKISKTFIITILFTSIIFEGVKMLYLSTWVIMNEFSV